MSDFLFFGASTFSAFALRFEGFEWGPQQTQAFLLYLLFSLPIKVLIFWVVGLYRRLWRHAGMVEVERLISASASAGLICLLIGVAVLPGLGLIESRVPLSVLFMDALITAAVATLPRFAVRAMGQRGQRQRLEEGRRALIVGAGAAGEMIVENS